jgi:predicted nuclease of predicted toxin-antitoxin system
MKILVDENIDEAFHEFMPLHDVLHLVHLGWKGKLNGELLSLASESNFEAFITADKNMVHQQNIKGRPFSLIVLDIHPNILANQVACIPTIEDHLKTAGKGEVILVQGPHPKRTA